MKKYEPHASSFGGMSANLAAMLGAILPFFFSLPGIAVSLLLGYTEKKSGLVKHYAFLSSIICFARFVLNRIFDGGLPWVAINMGTAALIALSAYYAYKWQEWDTPVFGSWGKKLRAKFDKAAYEGDGPVPPGCEQGSGSVFGGRQADGQTDDQTRQVPELPEMQDTVIDVSDLAGQEAEKVPVGKAGEAVTRAAAQQVHATPAEVTEQVPEPEPKKADPPGAPFDVEPSPPLELELPPAPPVPQYMLPYLDTPPVPEAPQPPPLPDETGKTPGGGQ